MEEVTPTGIHESGTTLTVDDVDAPAMVDHVRQAALPIAASLARELSPHVLTSTVEMSVSFSEPAGGLRCVHGWFHWNGVELVLCSAGPAPWSGLQKAPVVVSIPVPAVSPQGSDCDDAELNRFTEFQGRATSDSVPGVAPEHRAAAVRYLGSVEGHLHGDDVGRYLVDCDERMHRLFITPDVPVFASSRASD